MTQENLQTVSLPNRTTKDYELIRASDVVTREILWLWYPFIPFGKVTLLQGDPGDGKSTFMLTVAALLTRGEPLPFPDAETEAEPMHFICQAIENDMENAVIPRLMKANADRDKLLFINEKIKPVFFDDDRFKSVIKDTGAKTLIIDPLILF